MKILRHVTYHRVARITFKSNLNPSDREAVSIVEFGKYDNLKDIIQEVFAKELVPEKEKENVREV